MITKLIIRGSAAFWNNIVKPFKSFFINTTCIYGGMQYGKALEMQEYLPAADVEIRLTKIQVFIMWIMNWDIFNYLSTFINSLSWLIGISQVWIIAFLWLIFIGIIIKIITMLRKLIVPKKQILEKQGFDLLKEIASYDTKKYNSEDKIKELEKKNLDYELKLKDLAETNKNLKKQTKDLSEKATLYDVSQYTIKSKK